MPLTGIAGIDYSFMDEIMRPWGDEPELKKTPKQKRNLLKEIRMDAEDLLLHLFKGQPRIVGTGYFGYERFVQGSRNFERDHATAVGSYVIYYSSTSIATIVCKPHKLLTVIETNSTSRANLGVQTLLSAIYDLLPGVQVKGTK